MFAERSLCYKYLGPTFFLHNVLINLIFQLHNYDVCVCVCKGISLSDMESYLKGQYSTYSMFLVVSTNNNCGM